MITLAPGSRVGHFEIAAPLGAGGMGEVYRARDPRLGRDVAIKVLPEAFSTDSDRLRRFEQEARAAAALNHPNILSVFDIGLHGDTPYIVSELLEGATLRARLRDGPLRNAGEVAIGIARGLAAAHARGIVHRDLKPENVFVTSDGGVKILDFGLAKLSAAGAETGDEATALAETRPGMVLGTPGYMAPEQVRGQRIDHRADIFALGVILYEMLSGQRAFRGSTAADTMAAILRNEPPPLTPGDRPVPPALARIVGRCLEKDPASRFQSASDLAFALEGLRALSGTAEVRQTTRRAWLPWALAGLAATAALVVAVGSWIWRAPSAPGVLKATILPTPGTTITDRSNIPARRLSLSPDGQRLAFTAAGRDGVIWLWVRRLDSVSAERLEGTEGAVYPFWSPDSRYLGFFSENGKRRSKLLTIDVSGGTPTPVCELATTNSTGGTWNKDGVILFGVFDALNREIQPEIQQVLASGGAPKPATVIDPASGETRHYSPYFLPDGRHFLYLAVGVKGGWAFEPNGIYVGSLDASDRTLVMPGGSTAKYANGHLLFVREGTLLMAQRFDVSSLKLMDDPVLVTDQLYVGGPTGAAGGFTVSNNGYLAYQGGADPPSQLTWFNRKGEPQGVLGEPELVGGIALSPDDSRVFAMTAFRPSVKPEMWIYDVERNFRSRIALDTSEPGAVWSPDSRRLAFASNRTNQPGLYVKPSSGVDQEELLLPSDQRVVPVSWSSNSSNSQFIAYTIGRERQEDLWVLPLSDRKPLPAATSRAMDYQGDFSPDGNWLAYVSTETGQPQVFAAPFPGPGEAIRISTTLGSAPRWRGHGGINEIFYVRGRALMVAAVTLKGQSLRVVGETRFPIDIRPRFNLGRFYDVSRDGQRVLVNQLVETIEHPVTVVANWTVALKK